MPIGRERVDVYDVATGERLLTPDELKAQAEAEATRADAETARADAETARAEELARRLQETEALLQTLLQKTQT